MRFRIRPGFRAFETPGAAITYEAVGPKSGVRPINGGRVLNLTAEQASAVLCRGHLGRLEPLDDEAKRFYGDTAPAVPDTVANPQRYAVRQEPKQVQFAVAGAR